jgi:hypothetical protein
MTQRGHSRPPERLVGRIDEARAFLERIKEGHPALSVAWIEQNVPYTPGPMAKFLEGMRKAGLQ